MSNVADIMTFRRLVVTIWHEQKRAWDPGNASDGPSDGARAVHEELASHPFYYRQIGQKELEEKLPTTDDPKSDFGPPYLRLPPIQDEEFAAFLSLRCDFAAEPPTIAMRVTMCCVVEGKVKYFPFRLESGENEHNFYHAQLGHMDPNVEPTPQWLPCSQPSFPLVAQCPVTAIVALLLTLYGVDKTGRLLNSHGISVAKLYSDN